MIEGAVLIAGRAERRPAAFRAWAPAAGAALEPGFPEADAADVDAAARAAEEAFAELRAAAPSRRAALLQDIARRLEERRDELVARAHAETALPAARLEGEIGRTAGQLRHFAERLVDGMVLGEVSEAGDPARRPQPRPELRLRYVPVGPVAVFCASNFPFAFSVAGGDTASALAAGCPVIVRGHWAHPGTAELVGRLLQEAVSSAGLPPGAFALLPGRDLEVGADLVRHPVIQAVGFTGSRRGGLHLAAVAASRPCPIPVFAEMSSSNPVFLMPRALAARTGQLAADFVASMTLGAGQFCTSPGLVFAAKGAALSAFAQAAAEALSSGAPPHAMLSEPIREAFERAVAQMHTRPAVRLLARGLAGGSPAEVPAHLFGATSADLRQHRELADEIFGAAALIVECDDAADVEVMARGLEGQLTATIHLAPGDEDDAARLLPLLERKAGRILVNGWPTGVEVSSAMVHGGPYPATSQPSTTSVGSLAVRRFQRPVCYQDVPASLLDR